MRLSLLVMVSVITLSRTSSIRKERDTCDQVLADFDACTLQAYNDYKTAFEGGDDGRPDWMARKSCNYMTAAVEDCGNKLIGECNSEEEVTANKDHQLTGILMQLQSSIEEWDSDKCPAIKDHIDRMRADKEGEGSDVQENVEEDGENDAGDVQVNDQGENDDANTDEPDQDGDVDKTVEEVQEGGDEDPAAVADADAETGDDDESSASSLIVSLPLMMTLYMTI